MFHLQKTEKPNSDWLEQRGDSLAYITEQFRGDLSFEHF